MADRRALLAESWSAAAAVYERQLVPRFAAWTSAALAELRRHPLPSRGGIVVPCCGVGQEVEALAVQHPDRAVTGVDLSPGMVAAATARLAAAGLSGRARAVVGDAAELDPALLPAAALLSCFGLQQLAPSPGPARALAAWVRGLSPGGVAVVCFWPERAEATGPWAVFEAALQADAPRAADAADAAASWAEDVTGTASRFADMLRNELIAHEMAWPSADEFWEVMTRGGPWAARRLKLGDAHMDGLKARWLAAGGFDARAPLAHSPCARHITLRRRRSCDGVSAL